MTQFINSTYFSYLICLNSVFVPHAHAADVLSAPHITSLKLYVHHLGPNALPIQWSDRVPRDLGRGLFEIAFKSPGTRRGRGSSDR